MTKISDEEYKVIGLHLQDIESEKIAEDICTSFTKVLSYIAKYKRTVTKGNVSDIYNMKKLREASGETSPGNIQVLTGEVCAEVAKNNLNVLNTNVQLAADDVVKAVRDTLLANKGKMLAGELRTLADTLAVIQTAFNPVGLANPADGLPSSNFLDSLKA